MKCFDSIKNFCQFRKELISSQNILYQVFSNEEAEKDDVVVTGSECAATNQSEEQQEENFIDISQAVKIKLEVPENDFTTHDMSFESDAMHDDGDPSLPYQFKVESQNTDLTIYSEF